ncbi:Uncharacterised protein [Mycobacteroides abscessus subsp. abscessus]|nr:Uncharacterised protein [Mycobacteroides abscessus subsp. abscessus]SIN55163.1 Uncharacterised protein [Mycobacteroides abscessus subsp. abscessus]SKO28436.1 Uncharacterised protein [Mycobacteroides abscessus subsp. abscessus]SKV55535.1 Uncharacterised protein [Mycobacteroides abscessus subsp. abscessus]
MITDIASTIQCRLTPRMYCHSSTDKPKDAPSESATVPTITRAAMKLRVVMSMMMNTRQIAAIPAINRSYVEPSFQSLAVDAAPAMYTLPPTRGVPLSASSAAFRTCSIRAIPSGDMGSPL